MERRLGSYLESVREKSPLIHNITNYVTANDVANMLLACGGSPIMSDEPSEIEEVTSHCAGLNLNLGTLNARRIESMFRAGKKANELEHVLLMDPVGAGASAYRLETIKQLLSQLKFDMIRGNMSELRAVVKTCEKERPMTSEYSRGVDEDFQDAVTEENLEAAVQFAKNAARQLGIMITISGNIDLVSDGTRCYVIRNGRSEMRKITGTGCQLSGMMTAFLAANPENHLDAAAAAVCTMGVAGEIGWSHLAPFEGNATYRNRIIDAVYQMDGKTLEEGANYEIR